MTDATLTHEPPKPTAVPAAMAPKRCQCGGNAGPGGECEQCSTKKSVLQRAGNGSAAPASIPASVGRTLASSGRPLDSPTRSLMESGFGRDFSGVRVHTDDQAAESARAVSARAYTVGQHVAFDRGQYQPETPAGRQLLAHELTHTIQQAGLQRYGLDAGTTIGAADSAPEREAESIARTISQGPALGPLSANVGPRHGAPVLSRAAAPGPEAGDEGPAREWEDVPAGSKLIGLGVTQMSKLKPGVVKPEVRAFRLPVFDLPPEKGPVSELWNSVAQAGGLESWIDSTGERSRAGLKQARPGSDELRRIWRIRAKLATPALAGAAWKQAGGDETGFNTNPTVHGILCDMDHIVELQIGGNNIPENVQVLESSNNQKSGRKIFEDLAKKAKEIQDVTPVETVVLHFDSVPKSVPEPSEVYEVERRVLDRTDGVTVSQAEEKGEEGDKVEQYKLTGAVTTYVLIPAGSRTPPKKQTVLLASSKIGRNKAASTLIPGMTLKTLNLEKSGSDTVTGAVDTDNKKTRLPITIKKEAGDITMVVASEDGKLSVPNKSAGLAFTYPYLSTGKITRLDIGSAGLSGEGILKPSLPLLSNLDLVVKFGPDELSVTAGLDPKKLSMAWARITKADLTLLLHPEFKPSGTIAFEVGPQGKPLVDGLVVITADTQGLLARGELTAYVPGVDKTSGTVEYRPATGWTGLIEIKTSKIPYVQDASVTARLSDKGVLLDGGLTVKVPGGSTVSVKVLRRDQKWLYTGKGQFNVPVPGVKPVDLDFEYDGEKIKGTGRAGVEVRGLSGSLVVHYNDGKISGDGDLNVKKGKAAGTIKIHLTERGRFWGEGEISYELTPNLIATAGLTVPEEGPVRLKGALEFPKPIHLFDPIKGDYQIFSIGVSIPIPGASVGPIGLKARIEGGLNAGYAIGPGEIRNARILAAMNPLEDKPDLDLKVTGQLWIPARAYVSGSITGLVVLDAVIASVSGGLTVTVTATLDGHFAASVDLHYQKSQFEAKAQFEVLLALGLLLALDAVVKAEAGIGPFKAETKKVWNLKSFKFDPGLKLGMKFPLEYSSDKPFKPPSFNDITWIKPQIDTSQMLAQIFAGSTSKQDPPA